MDLFFLGGRGSKATEKSDGDPAGTARILDSETRIASIGEESEAMEAEGGGDSFRGGSPPLRRRIAPRWAAKDADTAQENLLKIVSSTAESPRT